MSVHRITGNDEIGLGADDVGGDGGDDSRERRRGCGLGGEVLTAAGDDVEARKGAIRRGGEIKGSGRQDKFKERKKRKGVSSALVKTTSFRIRSATLPRQLPLLAKAEFQFIPN